MCVCVCVCVCVCYEVRADCLNICSFNFPLSKNKRKYFKSEPIRKHYCCIDVYFDIGWRASQALTVILTLTTVYLYQRQNVNHPPYSTRTSSVLEKSRWNFMYK